MLYRPARVEDWPAITELVNDSSTYAPADAAVLADGGVWLVAEDDEGVAGCIWTLMSGRHAFVEYLVVRPDCRNGTGVRLAVYAARQLKKAGVQYVRALTANKTVKRMVHSLGGLTEDGYASAGVYLGE